MTPLLGFRSNELEREFREHFSATRVKYDLLACLFECLASLAFFGKVVAGSSDVALQKTFVFEFVHRMTPALAYFTLGRSQYTIARRPLLVAHRLIKPIWFVGFLVVGDVPSMSCDLIKGCLPSTVTAQLMYPLFGQLLILDHLALQALMVASSTMLMMWDGGVCSTLHSPKLLACEECSKLVQFTDGFTAGVHRYTGLMALPLVAPKDSCRVLWPFVLLLAAAAVTVLCYYLEFRLRAAFLQSRGAVRPIPNTRALTGMMVKHWNVGLWLMVLYWLALVAWTNGPQAGRQGG